MLKKCNYILTIMLYPFLLALSYLTMSDFIKGSIYKYVIIFSFILLFPSFILCLYLTAEDIFKSNKKWRIFFLLFLSIFYLPIYYTKNILKEEKYLGYFLSVLSIGLTIITSSVLYDKLLNYFSDIYQDRVVVIKNQSTYYSKDYLFSIQVDNSFRCDKENSGDYVLSCERLDDDSFIGIYDYDISYDNEEQIQEKLDFHLHQTINYITENGYDYEVFNNQNIVQINYDSNVILITQNNYLFNDSKYSLIIMKEVPKDYLNYDIFQKMIDSIVFLNYNEGVSS